MKKKMCGLVVVLLLLLGCQAALAADYSSIGFALMKNETVGSLHLDLVADEAAKILGEPESKSEWKRWGADGLEHQDWFYGNGALCIGMVKTRDGISAIDRLMLKSPSQLKTARGIGIGSSVQDVQNAYRNEINPNGGITDGQVVAGTVYGGIIFRLQDGVVSSVFVGAAAE